MKFVTICFLSTTVLGLGGALLGCGDGGSGSGGTGGSTTTTSSSSSETTSTGGGGATGGTGGATGGTGGATGGTGGSAEPLQIGIHFEANVGAEPFGCGKTFSGVGSPATDVTIADYRLYVHDVALHKADGTLVPVTLDQDGLWQYQTVALLDFEDGSGSCQNGTPETNAVVNGSVPAGEYDGIHFKVGVPFELNHQDAAVAPSPLNLSALFWSWLGGYKFLRIDSLPAGSDAAFNLHLGSTDCVEDGNGGVASCSRPNSPEVNLTGFDPLTTPIVIDYAAVVASSDLKTNGGGPPGCMSGAMDPECGPVFEKLGIDIADGSIHPDNQVLFHAK
ncbi:MAG: metallo-mystery pair system four-Cys motif protein [Polyangiaceae bacterium]